MLQYQFQITLPIEKSFQRNTHKKMQTQAKHPVENKCETIFSFFFY